MKLYHGSFDGDIKVLKPISKCNDEKGKKVVYLTQSREYALFYIWDSGHNGRKQKWVTCYIKEGVVHYEEQFSNQLYKFYNGVSGYLYFADLNVNITKAREQLMWYTEQEVAKFTIEKIENVFAEIVKGEKEGKIVIHRYNELEKDKKMLIDKKMAEYIIMKDLFNSNCDDAKFMKKHHIDAWQLAKEKLKSGE